jgi:glycosyltransferase involved in cell wall biosynthesis
MYPGSLNYHQGLDIAIRAFHSIQDRIEGAEFHIYGMGNEEKNLKKLVQELGLENRVLFKKTLALDEIAEVMSRADLGIVPKRNGFFGGEAFSTKILEFMSLGVPVLVAETKIDGYYFNNRVVRFSKPEDENDLGEKMLLLLQNPKLRDELSRQASEFVKDFIWARKEREYFRIVDSLVENR